MLDSFLKIIEKGIELVNLKQNNDKLYFEQIVDPLYKDFSEVVSEYFRLFSEKGISKEKAEEIRNGYIQSRISVTELAKQMASKTSDPELLEFFNAVSEYFYGEFVFPEPIRQSNGRYYIEIISGERTFSKGFKTPKSLVEIRDSLERKWENVVRIYGSLKHRFCMPVGYKA